MPERRNNGATERASHAVKSALGKSGLGGTSGGLIGLAVGAGAALTGMAVWAGRRAKSSEQANPAMGSFIEVGGSTLHYLARGTGRPVVFIHGLGGMVQDWHLSVLEQAAAKHRCIAFDRPGYGYSSRPRFSRWWPDKQAEILRRAARRMGAERPLVVGHDFGALVALSWAVNFPEDLAGVVLLSGYYYPTRRLDIPALSGLVGMARHTVAPLMGRTAMAKVQEKLFAPNPVPDLMSLYPVDLMLRGSQMRAQGEDLAHLKEAARRLSERYGEIRCPVVIMTGDSDHVVDPIAQSIKLHRDIPHSALRMIAGGGHMIHHSYPSEIMEGIDLGWHEYDVQARAMMPVQTLASGDASMPAAATQPPGG